VETAEVAVGWSAANVRVDGLISRSINGTGVTPSAPQVIATWRAGGFNPTTWIIALGTNGSGNDLATQKGYINSLLDTIAAGTTGVHKVFWVGLAYLDPANADSLRFLQAMTEVDAARTDLNMVPIDYNALLHNGRDETGLWASDPHMTTAGYTLRNQIISGLTGIV
jgi:hypothetical protein